MCPQRVIGQIHQDGGRDSRSQPRTWAQCRVCLKPLRGYEEYVSVHYRGVPYVVCCPSCAAVFRGAPEDYIGEV